MSCEFRILDFNYAWQAATSVTATTESPDFPASNLKNQIRAYSWRSTGVSAQAVVFDLRTAEEIDSVVLVFDHTTGCKLSTNAVIKVQASATNVWSSPPVDQTLTVDETNMVASHYFSTAQEYRYWRVYVDDPTNAFGYIEIPKVILAKATQLSQNPNNGFSYKLKDQSKTQLTEYGHSYSDIYPNRRAFDFDYGAITEADMQSLSDIFERVGSVRCIALDLDSTASVFDKDRFFIYGKLIGEVESKHRVFSYFDSGLTVEETF